MLLTMARRVVVSTSAGLFTGVFGRCTGDHYTDAAATTGLMLQREPTQYTATRIYAVDNNATLAICDFVFCRGVAAGAFSIQFVYNSATGAV